MTINEIKIANKSAGYFFFEPSSRRFFRSVISRNVYEGPGGIYFTTSEQYIPSQRQPAPRRYTVRQFDPETRHVNTVGDFNRITSRDVAASIARKLASGEIPAPNQDS